jgi:hypothetical protein
MKNAEVAGVGGENVVAPEGGTGDDGPVHNVAAAGCCKEEPDPSRRFECESLHERDSEELAEARAPLASPDFRDNSSRHHDRHTPGHDRAEERHNALVGSLDGDESAGV